MNYDYTDKIILYIDKELIEEYSKLKCLASFDEINVLESVKTLRKKISALVRKAFRRLANNVYNDNRKVNGVQHIDNDWIDFLLSTYDPVSKYSFDAELERKCARLTEAILASSTKTQEIDAALRAMSFMCRIYADRITDEAVMQAYKDDGEDYVLWVAENDAKTCSVCRKRNGKIYETDNVPPDPHPNCRCRRERV